MGLTQREKGQRFQRLHEGACFVIPNPWDVGSARVLAGMGFAALATSSAAAAAEIGKRDGELTREQALAHARTIVGATELPVFPTKPSTCPRFTESWGRTLMLPG